MYMTFAGNLGFGPVFVGRVLVYRVVQIETDVHTGQGQIQNLFLGGGGGGGA